MAAAPSAMEGGNWRVTIRPLARRWWPTCSTAMLAERRLVAQVTGTVRWRECVSYMAAHASPTSTRSARQVLSGLIKRIADGASEPRSARPRTSERSRRPACGRGKTCGEVDVSRPAPLCDFHHISGGAARLGSRLRSTGMMKMNPSPPG